MGKKRKVEMGKPQRRKEEPSDFNDSCLLDPSSREFIYDEVDNFHDNEDSQILLDASKRMGSRKAKQEQVLGIGGYSSSEEISEESDVELDASDIESGEEKEYEEDERTMGKKKKFYFGTDITDERIHKEARYKNRKKGDALLLEEEGARQLQNRMASQLEGLSFSDLLPQISQEKRKTNDEESEPSSSSLGKRKTLKALKKKSPELLPIFEDLKDKMEELNLKLLPLIEAKKKNLLKDSPSVQYLQTKYFLCLNYLTAISAYMMVKCSGAQLTQHPAVSRLAQYRHLFKEMESCDMKYGPELDSLLDDLNSGVLQEDVTETKTKKARKMLSILKEKTSNETKDEVSPHIVDDKLHTQIERNLNNDDSLSDSESDLSSVEEENKEIEEVDDSNVSVSDNRRIITYEISKNKGLMPSRKKEQRNPRVRYKKKYHNKLKRRKGQVREVRKELQRYEGEISGIKANLVKSIKLK